MNAPLNVAVIGAGRIGQIHAAHLATRIPGARLAMVADLRAEAAEQLAARYGARASDDYRAALASPGVDAVAICSATDTHARMIVEAAAAGKQIFCEKPIAHDLGAIDEALAAVARAGVALQVGFNRRFDRNFRAARAAIADGSIGQPHLLRITSRDPAPPPLEYIAVSGGLFLDMTIHDFDMARYLLADEVVEVFAVGDSLVDPAIGAAGDIDTAAITLRFASGAIGMIDNSRRSTYGYDQRAEVFGSLGAVSVGNQPTHTTVLSGAAGITGAKALHFFLERYADAYLAELQAFVDAVRAGQTPPVTGADGRAPVVIALAAQRSLAERRAVRLEEISAARGG